MASGIARGRVRTTTTESRNMAAIFQITGWERETSMLWSTDTCQNKVSADQYRVTIVRAQVNSSSRSSGFLSWRWPGAGFSIGSRAHDWLTCWKLGRIVGKPVNAQPGLNVNQIITFTSMQMFLLLFVYIVIIETQNRRPNNIQNTSAQSYKTQIKIYFFLG